jgi:hypothetical protein
LTALEVGKTYAVPNQGAAMTPRTVDVTVVWLEDDAVHYRKAGETEVRQTPYARSLEILAGSPSSVTVR